MTTEAEILSRLKAIEDEILQIKVTRGTLKLSPHVLTLVWIFVLGIVSASMFLARIDGRLTQMTLRYADLTSTMAEHMRLDGHPVELERLRDLERRVLRLEELQGKQLNTQDTGR